MITWGISANSHDAAITVVDGTNILFASQSERYSKKKNDPHLHVDLISSALHYGTPSQIVWYENPWLKTLRQFRASQGFINNSIKNYLSRYNIPTKNVTYVSHHKSHAAAGYYTSPFKEAAILNIDAIGEWDTTTIWHGNGENIKKLYKMTYPNSIGLWYSAMTQRIGLKPNEEEYILMGMAAYGDPFKYAGDIINDFFSDFDNLKFRHNLHRGCRWWKPELSGKQDHYDIAAATQYVYEMCFRILLEKTKKLTNSDNLVLGGGCALNCVANSIAFDYFKEVWIMPNPGDAGNSLGAITAHQQEFLNWKTPYLGHNIDKIYPAEEMVDILKFQKIVGIANGRAEFGPRALGHRSLLADPRGPEIKDKVNEIKRRQKFRPFAPAILEEYADDYFDMVTDSSPYMQYTMICKDPEQFPAIIHVDGTSRVQTVSKDNSPDFHNFLSLWYEETGCPMVLNTSLNIKGQPIVNDRVDALKFSQHYTIAVL